MCNPRKMACGAGTLQWQKTHNICIVAHPHLFNEAQTIR